MSGVIDEQQCPECGQVCRSLGGLGAHRRHRHGVEGKWGRTRGEDSWCPVLVRMPQESCTTRSWSTPRPTSARWLRPSVALYAFTWRPRTRENDGMTSRAEWTALASSFSAMNKNPARG